MFPFARDKETGTRADVIREPFRAGPFASGAPELLALGDGSCATARAGGYSISPSSCLAFAKSRSQIQSR